MGWWVTIRQKGKKVKIIIIKMFIINGLLNCYISLSIRLFRESPGRGEASTISDDIHLRRN